MKKSKKIPEFNSEEEESEFWQKHDSADYIDWSSAQKVALPNLKPSTHTISVRMPEALLNRLKIIAHKKDIPYQSLIKTYLDEKVKEDL